MLDGDSAELALAVALLNAAWSLLRVLEDDAIAPLWPLLQRHHWCASPPLLSVALPLDSITTMYTSSRPFFS